MLYIVGLGLADEKDVTLKGYEAIKGSSRVYLEAYTSILGISQERLEKFYEKSLVVADRDMVETDSDAILENADKEDVSFLVVGDPLGATTHTDLILRAIEKNVPYMVIHNASVMNAVGAVGLALYNYGQTVSIPFFTDSWKPASWLDRIKENLNLSLHTLCLLDIKVKEQSEENLARGRKIFEPPRFMSVPCAIEQLIYLLENNEEHVNSIDPKTTLAISASRVGAPTQKFVSGTLEELSKLTEEDFGGPLHSFVIVGKRFHVLERDFGARFAVDKESWNRVAKENYEVKD